MGVAEKTSGAPLPAKLAGLLREAKWLILVALAAYLNVLSVRDLAVLHRAVDIIERVVRPSVSTNKAGDGV